MTDKEAAALVVMLKASYPNQKIEPATVQAYQHALADEDFQMARQAVDDIVSTEKFFPSISEIKHAIAIRRLDAPVAAIAWEQFAENDPERHELVKRVGKAMGGHWAYKTSENMDVFRAHFLKLYDGMLIDTLREIARDGRSSVLELEEAPAAALQGARGEIEA